MDKLKELKEKLPALQKNYGEKYFIFIAPFDLPKCQELKIFDYYVFNKIRPPDSIVVDIDNLDIYLIEYNRITGMNQGQPLPFHRLSTVDITKL